MWPATLAFVIKLCWFLKTWNRELRVLLHVCWTRNFELEIFRFQFKMICLIHLRNQNHDSSWIGISKALLRRRFTGEMRFRLEPKNFSSDVIVRDGQHFDKSSGGRSKQGVGSGWSAPKAFSSNVMKSVAHQNIANMLHSFTANVIYGPFQRVQMIKKSWLLITKKGDIAMIFVFVITALG